MKNFILLPIILMSLFLIVSCTANGHDDLFIESAVTKNAEITVLQKELNLLKVKMVPNKTIQGAAKNGYSKNFLGTHSTIYSYYINKELVDDTFNIDSPEIIMFQRESNGDYSFIGVAYAIPLQIFKNKDFIIPDGFYGSEDQWVLDKINNVMILHVWLDIYNNNGVFSPSIPDYEFSPGDDLTHFQE